MFILCNLKIPSVVLDQRRTAAVGDICPAGRVYVISDEISDFCLVPIPALVFAGLKPEYADNTITCTVHQNLIYLTSDFQYIYKG